MGVPVIEVYLGCPWMCGGSRCIWGPVGEQRWGGVCRIVVKAVCALGCGMLDDGCGMCPIEESEGWRRDAGREGWEVGREGWEVGR